MSAVEIISLGAALVDTEVKVSEHDLIELGLQKGQMTLSDARTQQKNLDHLREHLSDFGRASGGSAANSMIAAARMGTSSYLTCQVGNDENGRFFLEDLRSAGVLYNQRGQSCEGVTGTCLVLITPDAERTLNTCLGVSETLDEQNIETERLKSASWLYIEGYLATSAPSLAAAAAMSREAARRGIPVALSLSDPGIVAHFRQSLSQLCPVGMDLLFANRDEALGWTGSSNLDDALTQLESQTSEYAITLGPQGAVIGWNGARWRVSSPQVDAVDSNGAGDAFAGVYLHARCAGLSPEQAGKLGCYAASRVVSKMGPRLSTEDALLTRNHQLKMLDTSA